MPNELSTNEQIAKRAAGALLACVVGAAALLYSQHVERKYVRGEYATVSNMIEGLDGESGTSERDWAIAYSRTLSNFDHYKTDPRSLSYDELHRIRNNLPEIKRTLKHDK